MTSQLSALLLAVASGPCDINQCLNDGASQREHMILFITDYVTGVPRGEKALGYVSLFPTSSLLPHLCHGY